MFVYDHAAHVLWFMVAGIDQSTKHADLVAVGPENKEPRLHLIQAQQ